MQSSIRSRIFVAMTSLLVISFTVIAWITIPQFKKQSSNYHEQRLERKKTQLLRSISYIFKDIEENIDPNSLDSIFNNKIFEIADVQNVNFSIYQLDGKLLNTSITKFVDQNIDKSILADLIKSKNKSIIEKKIINGEQYRSSYSFIYDNFSNPILILNIPYYDDDSLNTYELDSFVIVIGGVYLFLLIIAILFSYGVSIYITRSLSEIGKKIKQTRLDKTNNKIQITAQTKEVNILVESYNKMVEKLNESVKKLAKSNKEQAWREMAKQVAHEIKNPLTPMRLSVQSFQKNFDIKDSKIENKIDEFTKTLIQQIDTMTTIAAAFSNFAEMPAQEGGKINIIETTKLALKIFKENYIIFTTDHKNIQVNIDRTQMIRIITNLIKNAIEACNEIKKPLIDVEILKNSNHVLFLVNDNGVGISKELKSKIFEPKFTTKSSGMGLGLGMVKNIVNSYNGTIAVKSKVGVGTTFKIKFPIKT
ncbi:MAG: sensor histidine kinase [Flavobacteriaceae bacterium]